MKLKQLEALIQLGESETTEFKTSFNNEALETIGAFANTDGGTLFIGIRDNGTICGIQIGKSTIEEISNRIQTATEPKIQPSILVSNIQDKSVIIIEVSKATKNHISIKGRYFKRVGKSTHIMGHEEIIQRISRSSGISWDGSIEPDTSVQDLDQKKINDLIERIKKRGRLPIPDITSNLEILEKLELVKENKPTRAGLLIVGKNPEHFVPSAFLKLGRFRSLTHIVDDREIHGTLIEQLDGAMRWFKERLETEFIFKGEPAREVKWEYPLEALREAVANILCHRDYLSNAHSQIRLYDNHLEMSNSGGLPYDLSVEDLFHRHKSISRNPKISRAFFYAGLIEEWGSGTIRIIDELKQWKMPLPNFETTLYDFNITFYRDIISEEKQKSDYEIHDELQNLTKLQKEITAILKIHKELSTSEIHSKLKNTVTDKTVRNHLNSLLELGVIKTKGATNKKVWFLTK